MTAAASREQPLAQQLHVFPGTAWPRLRYHPNTRRFAESAQHLLHPRGLWRRRGGEWDVLVPLRHVHAGRHNVRLDQHPFQPCAGAHVRGAVHRGSARVPERRVGGWLGLGIRVPQGRRGRGLQRVRVACRADSECRDSNGGGEPNNGWTRCSSDNCNPCGHNPSFIEAVGIGGVIGIAIGGLFVLAACAAGVFWCINGRPGWNATQNPRAGARVFNPANEEPPPPKYEEAAQGEYVQVSPPV